MPTIYLIFAHTVADFLLQPLELVRWKYKSWKGTAVHAAIHLLVSLIVLAPYLPNLRVFEVFVLIATAHFLIDQLKILGEKRTNKYFLLFLADQACHLSVLMLGGLAINMEQVLYSGWLMDYYANPLIVVGLLWMILISFPFDILQYQLELEKNKSATLHPHYAAIFKRVFIFTLTYAAFLIFGIYQVAALPL